MANGASNIKVRRAMELLAAGAQIEVGIEPANPEFNLLLLDYKMRRRLLVQSLFTQPGGRRHDAKSHVETVKRMDEDCQALTAGLTPS